LQYVTFEKCTFNESLDRHEWTYVRYKKLQRMVLQVKGWSVAVCAELPNSTMPEEKEAPGLQIKELENGPLQLPDPTHATVWNFGEKAECGLECMTKPTQNTILICSDDVR
jgi:hypothetical protein